MLHNVEHVEIRNVKMFLKNQVHVVILITSERSNYVF
jgi:hypothetical protein